MIPKHWTDCEQKARKYRIRAIDIAEAYNIRTPWDEIVDHAETEEELLELLQGDDGAGPGTVRFCIPPHSHAHETCVVRLLFLAKDTARRVFLLGRTHWGTQACSIICQEIVRHEASYETLRNIFENELADTPLDCAERDIFRHELLARAPNQGERYRLYAEATKSASAFAFRILRSILENAKHSVEARKLLIDCDQHHPALRELCIRKIVALPK